MGVPCPSPTPVQNSTTGALAAAQFTAGRLVYVGHKRGSPQHVAGSESLQVNEIPICGLELEGIRLTLTAGLSRSCSTFQFVFDLVLPILFQIGIEPD